MISSTQRRLVSKGLVLLAGAIASASYLGAPPHRASAQSVFYLASRAELAGRPGTLIRAEPMHGAPDNAAAYRILYRSTGLHNEPIAVSGIVVVPEGPVPAGGRPIVAWAHPTTGVVPRCAPSLALFVFRQIQGLRNMVQRGYVVSATDYPGLGTPGPHPYLVGISEGRAVLELRARGTRATARRRRTALRGVGAFAGRPSFALYRDFGEDLRAGIKPRRRRSGSAGDRTRDADGRRPQHQWRQKSCRHDVVVVGARVQCADGACRPGASHTGREPPGGGMSRIDLRFRCPATNRTRAGASLSISAKPRSARAVAVARCKQYARSFTRCATCLPVTGSRRQTCSAGCDKELCADSCAAAGAKCGWLCCPGSITASLPAIAQAWRSTGWLPGLPAQTSPNDCGGN